MVDIAMLDPVLFRAIKRIVQIPGKLPKIFAEKDGRTFELPLLIPEYVTRKACQQSALTAEVVAFIVQKALGKKPTVYDEDGGKRTWYFE